MPKRPHKPIIVTVGGFLGSGKTSLIIAAARLLRARGVKTAAVMNDQGSDLVDTSLVRANEIEAGQVLGGCFCCRLSALIEAARGLRAFNPDVIFAEAVGSCTDIWATVIQPLKLDHAGEFRVAPYTVLIDPERARNRMDADSAFLFDKQIEEADLVCFAKTDRVTEFPPLPGRSSRYLSSVTGEGVSAWLDDVLGGRFRSGRSVLEVDYEQYARAEASLAWMNCRARIEPTVPVPPALIVGPLLDDLDSMLTAEGLRIAHIKVMDQSRQGWLKAAIISNGAEPSVQGDLDASPAEVHDVLLNARVTGSPDRLRTIVERCLSTIVGRVIVESMQCFSPSPPRPEKRLPYVVA